MKSITLALGLLSLSVSAFADTGNPMIVVTPANPAAREVGIDELLASPGMTASHDEVVTRARQKLALSNIMDASLKRVISQSLDELPFHRVIDIKLSFLSGIPDMFGVCLDGHPTNQLTIEACASTMIFLSSLTAAVKYRWDLVLHQSPNGHIHELALGPGAGLRRFQTLCFDSCGAQGGGGWGADVMASLEYVFWISKHFGLTAELDLGASYLMYDGDASMNRIIPNGKLTVGFAF